MNLPITLALLAVGVVLTVFCGWMGQRPKTPGVTPLAPWQLLMLASAAWCLMMVVHLLNLFGAQTGGGQRY